MKKIVRYNIYETNSSSCHSLIIKKNSKPFYNYITLDGDGYVHINFGNFGWGLETYANATKKLSYAVTMVAETEYYDSEDDFYKTDGMKKINSLIADALDCNGVIVDNPNFQEESYTWNGHTEYYMSHNGYIDHQSCEYDSLQDFLDTWDITLERFIFDDNVCLVIDNDNH